MSKPITVRGEKFSSIKEACEYFHINYQTIINRIRTYGWDLDRAFSTSIVPHKVVSRDHLGKTYPSITAMAKAYNLDQGVVRTRLNRGWSMKEALTQPLYVLRDTAKEGIRR